MSEKYADSKCDKYVRPEDISMALAGIGLGTGYDTCSDTEKYIYVREPKRSRENQRLERAFREIRRMRSDGYNFE